MGLMVEKEEGEEEEIDQGNTCNIYARTDEIIGLYASKNGMTGAGW